MLLAPTTAQALSVSEAVRVAFKNNPEIFEAIENREATEFELRQALGEYLPRVDLEASVGAQMLNNPSRRAAGIDDDPLYPAEVGVVVTQELLDGGARDARTDRQAARVDSASLKVLERSQGIALEVSRVYLEILLQGEIADIAGRNQSFHQETLDDVSEAISSGRLTEAERQQVTERMAAASAKATEALEALLTARIGFERQVGVPFSRAQMPPQPGNAMPDNVSKAMDLALMNNARVRMAGADLRATSAQVDQAESAFGPDLTFEARGTLGSDIGSSEGYTTDLQGRLTLRWNIFDGGIKSAKVQESIRRESEAMYAQKRVGADVRESVRKAWTRVNKQRELARLYREQLAASEELVQSYREQFRVGQRSLLDVLEAQNTRFSTQILARTASFSARLAEYRVMAATGRLLSFLGVEAPGQAEPYARKMVGADEPLDERPERKPVDYSSAPIDLVKFAE